MVGNTIKKWIHGKNLSRVASTFQQSTLKAASHISHQQVTALATTVVSEWDNKCKECSPCHVSSSCNLRWILLKQRLLFLFSKFIQKPCKIWLNLLLYWFRSAFGFGGFGIMQSYDKSSIRLVASPKVSCCIDIFMIFWLLSRLVIWQWLMWNTVKHISLEVIQGVLGCLLSYYTNGII